VTALGNPKLLERVSACLVQCRALFSRFDTDNRGYITKERFRTVYHELFEADSQSEVDEVRFRQKTEEDRQKERERDRKNRRRQTTDACEVL
jgi:Ca2+-binding EF-hand superfamily protein